MIRGAPGERNKGPILEGLKTFLSPYSTQYALEIASGTGQHVSYFAKHFQNIVWQPTEIDTVGLSSIEKFIQCERLHNVRPPLVVDVARSIEEWPFQVSMNTYDLMVCINMIHISPWRATEGLFRAAGQLLKNNGLLFAYGPFAVNGTMARFTSARLDESLRGRNPEWGVRDTRDLEWLAMSNNLQLSHILDMPANNKLLVFSKH